MAVVIRVFLEVKNPSGTQGYCGTVYYKDSNTVWTNKWNKEFMQPQCNMIIYIRWPRLRLWRWLVVGPREEWHVLLGSWLLRTGTWASTIVLSSPLCVLEFSLNTDRQFGFRLFIVSKFGWPFMLLPRLGLGQAWLRPGVTSVIWTTPSSEVWCHRHSKCVICILHFQTTNDVQWNAFHATP